MGMTHGVAVRRRGRHRSIACLIIAKVSGNRQPYHSSIAALAERDLLGAYLSRLLCDIQDVHRAALRTRRFVTLAPARNALM